MPGDPMCREAEQRFKETMTNLSSRCKSELIRLPLVVTSDNTLEPTTAVEHTTKDSPLRIQLKTLNHYTPSNKI